MSLVISEAKRERKIDATINFNNLEKENASWNVIKLFIA